MDVVATVNNSDYFAMCYQQHIGNVMLSISTLLCFASTLTTLNTLCALYTVHHSIAAFGHPLRTD